jgi:hypothetical protein
VVVLMPYSAAVRPTRRAISPRLAMRIDCNGFPFAELEDAREEAFRYVVGRVLESREARLRSIVRISIGYSGAPVLYALHGVGVYKVIVNMGALVRNSA